MATTLYAARGRLIPFNSNSPTGSTRTALSTFINTRGLMRICPGFAHPRGGRRRWTLCLWRRESFPPREPKPAHERVGRVGVINNRVGQWFILIGELIDNALTVGNS